MWILALEMIFTLPSELRSSLRVLTIFNNGNATLLELFLFSIHDLHRLFDEIKLVIELNLFKRNDQVLARHTLLEILNDPTYHGLNFPRFPKRITPLQGDTFSITISPTLNSKAIGDDSRGGGGDGGVMWCRLWWCSNGDDDGVGGGYVVRRWGGSSGDGVDMVAGILLEMVRGVGIFERRRENFVPLRNTYCLLVRNITAWLSVNQSIQIMTSKLPSPMGIKAMLKGVSKGLRCNLIACYRLLIALIASLIEYLVSRLDGTMLFRILKKGMNVIFP
uniref:Uncharacterized protein n=1 Tax=Tanacetum cinerariifolium TaxID=118510 RepID=A0A6L2KXF3_TANCI|nr:hypothetical protein [Tanacetum cinerariifolium]